MSELLTDNSGVESIPLSPSFDRESQDKISLELVQVWQKHQLQYINRIAILEEALKVWQSGKLSAKLRQNAVREAHSLTGWVVLVWS